MYNVYMRMMMKYIWASSGGADKTYERRKMQKKIVQNDSKHRYFSLQFFFHSPASMFFFSLFSLSVEYFIRKFDLFSFFLDHLGPFWLRSKTLDSLLWIWVIMQFIVPSNSMRYCSYLEIATWI